MCAALLGLMLVCSTTDLGASGRAAAGGWPRPGYRARKERRAVQEKVDVARAGDFHALDARDARELGGNLLRDLFGRATQPLGQFEGHRRGHFTHANIRRRLRDSADIGNAALGKEFG